MAMQENAQFKKSVDNLIHQLKSDPFAVISELGLNPEEIARKHLEKIVEDRQKSPEEKEREELRQKLQKYEQQMQEEKGRREELEYQQLNNEAKMNLENEVLEALERNPDLPKTPKVMREIGNVMQMFIKQGMDDLSVEDVIPTVKHRLQREFNELIGSFGDRMDLFEQYIGKQNLEKYRNKKLETMKNRPAPIEKKVTQTTRNTEVSKPKPKVSLEKWLRGL